MMSTSMTWTCVVMRGTYMIFVIKPNTSNEAIISSPFAPKNTFTPQYIFQRVLPVIIGLAVIQKYGLMSGLAAYMGILIMYELVLWVWDRRA